MVRVNLFQGHNLDKPITWEAPRCLGCKALTNRLSAQLEPLDEGLVRLQELASQLDRALAPDL